MGKIGVDILELKRGSKIVMAIDYFSRKLYAESIKSKEPKNVLKFLEKVYSELPFKTIISDNGREFNNKLIYSWITKNKIEQKFAVPHYHQSNGRIERANRTIRNALKKTTGSFKCNLQSVINNYNNLSHRALGMSPNEAMMEENFQKIKDREQIYKKEFITKIKNKENIIEGSKVLIKNEIPNDKMKKLFFEKGTVIKKESDNIFEVRKENGNIIRRHTSQLKRI